MAIISSHTLNSVDGSHAGGIGVRLVNLDTGAVVFDTVMDDGGRLMQTVTRPDPGTRYELIFHTGPYWESRLEQSHGARIMDEIIMRLTMKDAEGRYHVPLIISPHGYSLWCSTEHG